MTRVLILGSAPNAVEARDWPREQFDAIVVINNAWRVRSDWTYFIHPEDFPQDRHPSDIAPGQQIVTHTDYIPSQNRYGGVVYAGATMAFTAAYWALGALRPDHLCFFGCDMVYPPSGHTHFYGTGTADPLRDDITLADLTAKANRFEYFAAQQDCLVSNLSQNPSALPYQRTHIADLDRFIPKRRQIDLDIARRALALEQAAGYFVGSGRYWEEDKQFSPDVIAEIDKAWAETFAACVSA
ncbi:hypothetical protein [Falsiphaeobacter marinintestinus]|uniref:hypothetical protein n=1 Tax=Falsiphaeobacter marinintestinus TaxID=1492905 RepID=UPI0011B5F97F|nr:hypothetical protein [Phaeobacter marinintestinus]